MHRFGCDGLGCGGFGRRSGLGGSRLRRRGRVINLVLRWKRARPVSQLSSQVIIVVIHHLRYDHAEGFRVEGLRVGVWVIGFGVWGLGFGVEGSGFTV